MDIMERAHYVRGVFDIHDPGHSTSKLPTTEGQKAPPKWDEATAGMELGRRSSVAGTDRSNSVTTRLCPHKMPTHPVGLSLSCQVASKNVTSLIC